MTDAMLEGDLRPYGLELLRHTDGYQRGLDGADAFFEATEAFDPDEIGSVRVAIVNGYFMHEQIVADEGGAPSSKVRPLQEAIMWREIMLGAAAGVDHFPQLDYQAHLMGFEQRYNQLLMAKHKDILDGIEARAKAREAGRIGLS